MVVTVLRMGENDPLAAGVVCLAGRAVAGVVGVAFGRIAEMNVYLSAQHALG